MSSIRFLLPSFEELPDFADVVYLEDSGYIPEVERDGQNRLIKAFGTIRTIKKGTHVSQKIRDQMKQRW
uniref:Uncharacterized protein n=1 Tax=Panagrolaimus superbus TaxID=310955 RepID=A0A914Z1C0_9BILA